MFKTLATEESQPSGKPNVFPDWVSPRDVSLLKYYLLSLHERISPGRILRGCSFVTSRTPASRAKRTGGRRSLAGCCPFPAPSVLWQVACIGHGRYQASH